jgi:SAM-dependent methyltransferase
MPIETIEFQGEDYPVFQSLGFAAQFAFPFAAKLCNGVGYDIGYSKEEWKLPGAIGIEPSIIPEFHATNLPPMSVDFIFSSHCLEHTPDWVAALDHWALRIKTGGVLFLYLPDYSQRYWRNWNNRKHIHNLSPEVIKEYLMDRRVWTKIKTTGADLNNSFYVIAEKL